MSTPKSKSSDTAVKLDLHITQLLVPHGETTLSTIYRYVLNHGTNNGRCVMMGPNIPAFSTHN